MIQAQYNAVKVWLYSEKIEMHDTKYGTLQFEIYQ